MRRKAGSLVSLEVAICEAAAKLARRGVHEFHGYEIAKRLSEEADAKLLTAYGTLYRALGRLERMGMLESRWENPQIALNESRPPRRLYTLTPAGEAAWREAEKTPRVAPKRARRRLARA